VRSLLYEFDTSKASYFFDFLSPDDICLKEDNLGFFFKNVKNSELHY